MKRNIDIQPSEIIVTGANKAGINSSDIATYLVQDGVDTIEDLSSIFGEMKASQISIDKDGVVIIDTEEFRKFSKDIINNPVTPVAGFACANKGCA